MKGVILAGGTGTRLLPITLGINKHLLPVGREPMIHNPIRQLVDSGIDDILVITGKKDVGGMVNALGDGSFFDAHLTYRPQRKPGGTAEALELAEKFAHGENIVVVLADTVGRKPITPFINAFKEQSEGARTLVRRVADPENYGIAEFANGRIARIEERPYKEKMGDYAILGYFMFDDQVFDIVKQVEVSERGEREMTDVLNGYISQSKLLFDVVSGDDFVDCGTFEGIERAEEWSRKGF